MGLGTWLSQYLKKTLSNLILLELALVICCGLSYGLFYLHFSSLSFAVGFLSLIGLLCGAEIPFVYDLFNQKKAEEGFIEKVLLADYLGMAFGAFLFSGIFLRSLGLHLTVVLILGLNLFVFLYLIGLRLWRA